MKRYFAIALLSLTGMNANAGVHKWVDTDGKVHYSDTRPDTDDTATQTVRNVAGKDQADAPAAPAQKSYAERDAEMKKAKQAKEDAAKKKTEQDTMAEAKNHNCDAARTNAKTIESGTRIVTYDAKGDRTYMDDNTRAKKLEEARETIANDCN